MTCTCKAELASILRDEARQWHDADDKNLARAFACVADRLCPQAEPATDWREKCVFEHSQLGCMVRYGQWRLVGSGPTKWSEIAGQYYPTESAARAALLAASEPGVEPARGLCTCNRNHVDDDEHAPDCGKPSPSPAVAFDAERWAEKIVGWNSLFNCWSLWDISGVNKSCACNFTSEREFTGNANITAARAAIAAALRAAGEHEYARGDAAGYARAAEQTPRPRYEVRGTLSNEVFGAFKHRHDAVEFMRNRTWVEIVDTQPAAPAAAELGKAATKRPWANHYIIAAANLDHAAIAAELRAKDAEIRRCRETLTEIARCAGATDACWHCRNLATAVLAPAAGDDHA